MFKIATVCLASFISFNICCKGFAASDGASSEPTVKPTFYNAEEIHESPALMSIRPFEPGHHKVVFELQNFPIHQEIIWEIKHLAGANPEAFQPYMSFSIQDDGTYLTSEQMPMKTLSIGSKDFLPGERAIFRFRTNDGSISRDVVGFPNPAFYKDKNGTITLSAELVHLSPTVYVIDMPTMEEGEEYAIKTVTIGETSKVKKAKYTRQAPFHFSPSVKGSSKGGDSYFEIERKSGDVYFLKLPWGTALDSHSKPRRIHDNNS